MAFEKLRQKMAASNATKAPRFQEKQEHNK